MTTMDKATANAIVGQLSHAVKVLEQGRAYGIRVVATPSCIDGLSLSDHPDRDRVIANIFVDKRPS